MATEGFPWYTEWTFFSRYVLPHHTACNHESLTRFTVCLLFWLPHIIPNLSCQMTAPPWAQFCRSILPIEVEFFRPTVVKCFLKGSRLIVGFSLWYSRICTLKYKASGGDCCCDLSLFLTLSVSLFNWTENWIIWNRPYGHRHVWMVSVSLCVQLCDSLRKKACMLL